jgi:hypothetical protein
LGQHSVQVLTEAGFDPKAIEALQMSGATNL